MAKKRRQMSDSEVLMRGAYRESVARWLRAAVRRARATTDITDEEIMAKSGVPRSTFYRILRRATVASPDSLVRLATALGVPAPQPELVLLLEDEPTPPIPTLAKLKEAAALLREAILDLEARPDATAEILAEDAVLNRLPSGRSAHPPRKKRHSGPA